MNKLDKEVKKRRKKLVNPFEGLPFITLTSGRWYKVREEGDKAVLTNKKKQQILVSKELFEQRRDHK